MRDFKGRFTSFKKFVSRAFVTLFVLSLVVGGTYVYITYGQVMKLDTTPVKVTTLNDRWDANLKTDIELEMNRSGFKAEMEKYALKTAKENVLHAYVNKLQQNIK